MTQMGAHKLFDNVTIAAAGTSTSAAIYMGQAQTMALHLQSIAGTGPDVSFTYQVSTNSDANFITPSAPVTIGVNQAAANVLDFAPEAAKFIRLIATNNNGAQSVTITAVLAMQED